MPQIGAQKNRGETDLWAPASLPNAHGDHPCPANGPANPCAKRGFLATEQRPFVSEQNKTSGLYSLYSVHVTTRQGLFDS